MLRSLYSGITGLRTHQVRMDVVANNIANVNTTGFKSARANFQDVLAQTIGRTAINTTQVGLGVGLAAIDNVFTQGPLQTTGRVLDLAIEGNGFFVVKPVDSGGTTIDNQMYTRDGTFYLDKNGYLVNAQGYRVQDEGGTDIQFTTVTPDKIATISIGTDGKITATGTDGTTEEHTIGLVTFNNVESLQRVGSNLWDVTAGLTQPDPPVIGAPGQEGRGIVRSGYLEMSNVDLAQEFTTMITTQRGYQANARIITTSDELLQELVNLKR
ncbi:MAG: flagellar basal-body rod protein FlgF [Bacillota bacterium]